MFNQILHYTVCDYITTNYKNSVTVKKQLGFVGVDMMNLRHTLNI